MTTPTTAPPAESSSTNHEPHGVVLSLDVERAARFLLLGCILVETTLLLLDYHVNYGRATDIGALRRMFNTAREDGLASWFAVTQTLLIALTLWLIYAMASASANRKKSTVGWLVLAAFFTYMAVDDGAQIHERLSTTFEKVHEAGGGSLDFFPSYAWQIIFLPMFAAIGVFTMRFLWLELETSRSRAVLVVAISLLVAAVGLDFLEGLDADHPWNAYTWASHRFDIETWTRARFGRSAFDALQHFSRSVEETLEMVANSLLWFLFVCHLPVVSDRVLVRFSRPAHEGARGPR